MNKATKEIRNRGTAAAAPSVVPDEQTHRGQIIVLGMHRSGTSMATRLINMLGAGVGPKTSLMPPNADNLKGFWERKDVQVLNDDILRALGCTWHRCGNFTSFENETKGTLQEFIDRARIIVQELDAHQPWVIKDPRMCLTLPVWRGLFDNPLIVYVFRSPFQVAQSLNRRNDFPLSVGFALWELYVALSLSATNDLPRYFIPFDELTGNTHATLSDLFEWLVKMGVHDLSLPPVNDVTEFIDSKLVHHKDNELRSQFLTLHQANLYDKLVGARSEGALPCLAPSRQAREILIAHETLEHAHNRIVERQKALDITRLGLKKARQELQEIQQELTAARKTTHDMQAQLEQRDSALEAAGKRDLLQQRFVLDMQHVIVFLDTVQQYESIEHRLSLWLDQLFEYASLIRRSRRWRLGSAAKSLSQVTSTDRTRCRAFHKLDSLQKKHLLCKQKRLGVRVNWKEECFRYLGLLTLISGEDMHDQVESWRNQRFQRLMDTCGQRSQAVLDMVDWLAQGISGLLAIEKSKQWQVGDTGMTSLARLLRSSTPRVSIFDSVRKLRASFIHYRSTLQFDLPQLVPMFLSTSKELQTVPQKQTVSVVMPTWNRADLLPDAIESLKRQSYANWRLELVDDGSEDDTREVVQKMAKADPRIHYHRIAHQGVSAARNFGLLQADGDFVAYLDSDNTWDPDYLVFMVNAMNTTSSDCAYCGVRLLNQDTNEVSIRFLYFDRDALLKNNYIDINVFVHRRLLTNSAGYFDTQLKRWVDWDFIIRCVTHSPPVIVPKTLCTYTISRKNKQITHVESGAFKNKVLNKYLVTWDAEKKRTPGHVTIVIPVFNQAEFTRNCIESILRYTEGNYDVLVVDNGSKDHTGRLLLELEAQHENISHVTNYENYGFALACNIGVDKAAGEYIVLLNNDTTVTPGWLEPLITPLQQQPETTQGIGVVGPKLLFPDDTLQCGGIVFSKKSAIPYHIYQGRQSGDPSVNKRRIFKALTGACMAIRAADFVNLHGFDPEFLNGGEDVDFCLRLKRDLGKSCVYDPASVVYHYEGKTEGRSSSIMYNRQILADRWHKRVPADDFRYYAEDGFKVLRYVKPGNEPHGETAVYHPELTQGKSVIESNENLVDIALCSMWYERGVTFLAHQYAQALEGQGFRTHIFARWESDKFHNAGQVRHPRVTNGGDDPSIDETVLWAKERNIKYWIQLEAHPKDWKRVEALQKANIPVMGYENLDILRKKSLDLYGRFDALLSNNFYTHDFFTNHFPDTPRLCLPWGVPADLPIVSETIRYDGRMTFVHVAGWGGINNRKNTGLLVKAFHKAGVENAVLRLFTQNEIESLGQDVADIVVSSPNIVCVQGTIPNIFEAYAGADMLLWPSKREGVGLPILEALACGLPCLLTDGWLMKQWLIPGKHGELCPATPEEGMMCLPEMQVDIEQLSSLIRELAKNRSHIDTMKENVRQDRHIWLWSWQPKVFREQIGNLLADPGYTPAEDLSYLPQEILQFEAIRRSSEINVA